MSLARAFSLPPRVPTLPKGTVLNSFHHRERSVYQVGVQMLTHLRDHLMLHLSSSTGSSLQPFPFSGCSLGRVLTGLLPQCFVRPTARAYARLRHLPEWIPKSSNAELPRLCRLAAADCFVWWPYSIACHYLLIFAAAGAKKTLFGSSISPYARAESRPHTRPADN